MLARADLRVVAWAVFAVALVLACVGGGVRAQTVPMYFGADITVSPNSTFGIGIVVDVPPGSSFRNARAFLHIEGAQYLASPNPLAVTVGPDFDLELAPDWFASWASNGSAGTIREPLWSCYPGELWVEVFCVDGNQCNPRPTGSVVWTTIWFQAGPTPGQITFTFDNDWAFWECQEPGSDPVVPQNWPDMMLDIFDEPSQSARFHAQPIYVYADSGPTGPPPGAGSLTYPDPELNVFVSNNSGGGGGNELMKAGAERSLWGAVKRLFR